MHETYGVADLLNTLIRLEETGARVYRELAEQAKDSSARDLFAFLSLQEAKHQKFYESLLQQQGFERELDEEYRQYIGVLIHNTMQLISAPRKGYSRATAIELGIQLEKDTLLFLGEMRHAIGSYHSDQLELITNQERKHLQLLIDIRS
jgi:rubrerythrin